MLRRIWAIVWKELIQIRRDRRTLGLALGVPVVQLLLFGYAISTEVRHIRLVVSDESRDAQSREFVQAYVSSTYFDLVEFVDSPGQAREAVDAGRARAGLIIPPDFSANLKSGRQALAQVLIDGSDPNSAQTALLAAGAIAQNQAAERTASHLGRTLGLQRIQPAIELRPVVLYNPNMESVSFMVPGLVGIILQMQTTMLTAFAIVRERERGTLEQLIVTPIGAWELMLGKLLPYAGLAMVSTGTILLTATFWFQVEFAGSAPLLVALIVVYLLGCLGIGMLISTVSRTQTQAMQATLSTMLPTILLSGFIFPIESMPAFAQALSYLIPLTYFLRIIRGIVLKGIGLEYLWPEALPMALFSLVIFVISANRFHKRLE